jgi:hypothetical protein
METVRIRKANATTEKEKVMYFVQDRDVSTRILAILSIGQTKSGVKKEVTGADGKSTAIFIPEITRYKVICGSNGKVGTRYNVIKIPKEEKGRVIKKTVIDNSTVGRRLTDEEFVNMYPSQCNIFKEIFKREFQVASQKIQKN